MFDVLIRAYALVALRGLRSARQDGQSRPGKYLDLPLTGFGLLITHRGVYTSLQPRRAAANGGLASRRGVFVGGWLYTRS
ncbi:hypothetical protein ACGFNU_25845 [Spirillospora sp. NPDC048911]|uniref:hypothetical protein n=1 Tax=Spirillospora sp. NPDC048911 TaxID=3364527 RepID=UPI003718EBA2